MSDDKYQRVIQWLLNNVNPELFEAANTLSRIGSQLKLSEKLPNNHQTPSSLQEVLKEVEMLEKTMRLITKTLVKGWVDPAKSDFGDLPTGIHSSELFSKIIPRIDASLSVIEEAIFIINENITNTQLEPVPDPLPNQTDLQRQVRFVDKTKRVRSNLSQIEASLAFKPSETTPTPVNAVELLYSPPPWSTPPKIKYFLEVVSAGVSVDRISIYQAGHYLIGRLPLCNIVIDDGTCSRQHAVIQFRPGDPNLLTGERVDEVYMFDLNSTSGTYVNAMALQPNAYYPLYLGDVLQFGQYPCQFILREGWEDIDEAACLATSKYTKHLATSTQVISPVVHEENIQEVPVPPVQAPVVEPEPKEQDPLVSASKVATVNNAKENLIPSQASSKQNEAPNDSLQNVLSAISLSETKKELPIFNEVKRSNEQSPAKLTHSGTQFPDAPKDHVDPVDPRSGTFDEDSYKRKMIEAYEKQQRENAEILRQRKEREAMGLPPLNDIPHVPERKPRSQTVSDVTNKSKDDKKKKKRWWQKK